MTDDDVIEIGGRRSGKSLRHLTRALGQVPVHPVRKDWDTPEGEAFIRAVIDFIDGGMLTLDELGAELGIDNLRHIVKARSKYL